MNTQTQEITKAKEQTPATTSASIISVIERAALNPDVDIDKMERLLEMQERIMAKESETLYSIDMNAAQSAMGIISQDASNSRTSSKYATYAALDKALRPIYTSHGFSVSFGTGDAPDGYVRVVAKVRHSSGHIEIEHIDIPNDGKGAKGGDVMTKTHAQMSGVTYGRRGLLKMIFNIAEGKDDDGNLAGAGELITEEQAAKIKTRLEDTNSNIPAFLKALKIGSVENMPELKHGRADAMLTKKENQIKSENVNND
ncbi:MAG: single-stranded DNA-binding protein [Chloroflexi bacterium]|nr:single-stranded DNA-binding protein [Chloroflexota bacterium]